VYNFQEQEYLINKSIASYLMNIQISQILEGFLKLMVHSSKIGRSYKDQLYCDLHFCASNC